MSTGKLHAAVTQAIVDDEAGATAVEYALLAALVAAVIVAIVTTLGTQVAGLFNMLVGAF